MDTLQIKFCNERFNKKSNSQIPQELLNNVAESEGVEPSMGDKAHTPLAGERLQPLGQLSKIKNTTAFRMSQNRLALF